jgi:hypothetical protein
MEGEFASMFLVEGVRNFNALQIAQRIKQIHKYQHSNFSIGFIARGVEFN